MQRRGRTWRLLIGAAMATLGLVISALPFPAGAAAAGHAHAQTASASPTVAPTATPSATSAPVATATPTVMPFAAAAQAPTLTPQINGYVSGVYTDPSGATMTYYLHIPSGYLPSLSYPLVLLLHGTGESAKRSATPQQNAAVILSDPYVKVWSSASIQASWPSFILVPQTITGARWSSGRPGNASFTLQPKPPSALQMAMAILATVEKYYPINPQRVYLTGLSMGGDGTWEAAERWPSAFAAVVPIAGAGDPTQAADLVDEPVWVFQSAHDTVLPISASLDMISAIKAAGGRPCFMEFSGSSHNTTTWMAVYTNTALLKWLFAQGTSGAARMQQCAA